MNSVWRDKADGSQTSGGFIWFRRNQAAAHFHVTAPLRLYCAMRFAKKHNVRSGQMKGKSCQVPGNRSQVRSLSVTRVFVPDNWKTGLQDCLQVLGNETVFENGSYQSTCRRVVVVSPPMHGADCLHSALKSLACFCDGLTVSLVTIVVVYGGPHRQDRILIKSKLHTVPLL